MTTPTKRQTAVALRVSAAVALSLGLVAGVAGGWEFLLVSIPALSTAWLLFNLSREITS